MRAMIFRAYGGPERLEAADLPRPTAGAGQLLIKVVAGSVNPIDWKRASGSMRLIMPVSFPAVPGYDIAGEVVELGSGVEGFRPGDRVHVRIAEGSGGGAAEYAVAGADVTARIPEGMSMAEAAGLPLAGMTALQGLRDACELPLSGASQRVLVVGASGGVGHLAVQIAKSTGATVVGVCSAKNAALVRELGADDVVDYAAPDPYRGQAPFDIILDCVAHDPKPFLPLLTDKGHYASTIPGATTFLRAAGNLFGGKKIHAVMLKTRGRDLAVLDRLVEAEKLRVVIDGHFPLADLKKAWERSLTGRAVGKIVIDVA